MNTGNPSNTSTLNEMLKFPCQRGIVTTRSTILIPAECTVITSSKEVPKKDEVRPKNFKIALHPNFPDQEVAIGGTLSTEGRMELRIFAYSTEEKGAGLGTCKIQAEIAESDKEKTLPQSPTHLTHYAAHSLASQAFSSTNHLGLKNSGATYQRLVDKAFDSQVGRNMEVYVDDLVIKSHTEDEMIRRLYNEKRFGLVTKKQTRAQQYNLKNVRYGGKEKNVTLGYMISPEGIKPCPDKTEVVLQLPSPWTIKEVQSLNGKLASLNRTSVKGQILADFLVEKPDENLPETPATDIPQEPWILFMDGSSCIDGSDAGLILTSPEGTEFHLRAKISGGSSHGSGRRENNIDDPDKEYLKDGTLPGDRKEASKLRIKARQYKLLEGVLYKRSFLKPWLRVSDHFKRIM
ncbi:hypothetical protein Tco_1548242 [Tanacetum coccineum]